MKLEFFAPEGGSEKGPKKKEKLELLEKAEKKLLKLKNAVDAYSNHPEDENAYVEAMGLRDAVMEKLLLSIGSSGEEFSRLKEIIEVTHVEGEEQKLHKGQATALNEALLHTLTEKNPSDEEIAHHLAYVLPDTEVLFEEVKLPPERRDHVKEIFTAIIKKKAIEDPVIKRYLPK